MPHEGVLTPQGMWTAAGVAAAADVILLVLLCRLVHAPGPDRLTRRIAIVGVVFFTGLFAWAFWTYWTGCYGHALPGFMKPLAPAIGALIGAVGWVFWRVARHTGRWAVPVFLLLGGAESFPGHANAIERMRLLERCPLLQGVSAASAYVFGFFEFAFYWSVVLGIAWLWTRHGASRR